MTTTKNIQTIQNDIAHFWGSENFCRPAGIADSLGRLEIESVGEVPGFICNGYLFWEHPTEANKMTKVPEKKHNR